MQFIRTLWGDEGRYDKILNDIDFIKEHPYKIDATCLTYGVANHKLLLDQGINSILIHEGPYKFPKNKIWAHKLYTWVEASRLYGKFLYLDWDILPLAPLPEDFDQSLECKRLQISLRRYVHVRCHWRDRKKRESRLLPCAAWIYFGDKNIPNELFELWKEMARPRREERVLAKYTEHNDSLDMNYYWENYEPHGETTYFYLENKTAFRKGKVRNKSLFKHYGFNKAPRKPLNNEENS